MMISVIGGGNNPPAEAMDMAEEVGRELARRGVVVVCGGLNGVMEAVCRGAKTQDGVTIGILPGNNAADANPWVDYPIVTGMRYARNVAVVKSGEAIIAVDGSYGTLSEIAHALSNGIPVIGLKTWSLAHDGKADEGIIPASTPVEAVELALEAAKQQSGTYKGTL